MAYFTRETTPGNPVRVTGDIVDNGVFIAYSKLFLMSDAQLAAFNISKHEDPPPGNFDPVPEIISDRQFFQALAMEGKITQAEALDAVKTGAIPAILQSAIASMTGADAFSAEMLLSGATEFRRSHPLTQQIGAAQGMTPDQIDTFFRFAASL